MNDDCTTLQKMDSPKILFVDDEPAILKSLARSARYDGWHIFLANSAQQAITLANDHDFSVIISDMRMPNMDGASLLKTFLTQKPDTVRILLSGYSDMSALMSAINDAHIYNYLIKPWNDVQLRQLITEAIQQRHTLIDQKKSVLLNDKKMTKLSKLALILKKQVQERSIEVDQSMLLLQQEHGRHTEALFDSLKILNRLINSHSHCAPQEDFVCLYSEKLAREIGLVGTDLEATKLTAALHKIGLLMLPEKIRTKPLYMLSVDERKLHQQHPLWAEQCLGQSGNLKNIARFVRHQNEYVNGEGYPDRLHTHQIPLISQIVGLVSDFYAAYQGDIEATIYGRDAAKEYVQSWAGKRYDTALVQSLSNIVLDIRCMPLSQRFLSVRELEPGMILNSDLHTRSGTLLLSKETTLTRTQISQLMKRERDQQEVFAVPVLIETQELHPSSQGDTL